MACLLKGKRSATSALLPLPDATMKRPRAPVASVQMCSVAHQFGLVGGKDYDSKEARLIQLLERFPTDGSLVVVFADVASSSAVQAIVDRCFRTQSEHHVQQPSCAAMDQWPRRRIPTPCRNAAAVRRLAPEGCKGAAQVPRVKVSFGRSPELPVEAGGCQYLINFDPPATGREYLRRLKVLDTSQSEEGAGVGVVYTFVEEKQLSGKPMCDIIELLSRAKRAAVVDPNLGGVGKAAELDSALQQLANEFDGWEEEDDDNDASCKDCDLCDCTHCTGCSVASTSYHSASRGTPPCVEVVRLPLHCLEDLASSAPLIAPRLGNHSCTVVCLHNLNVHTPWDGAEHLFALPPGFGSVRVVMVLATDCSWHEYLDAGSFAGGVAWIDIMDPATMDTTDKLIAKLVDHEISLLDGHSERLVLMGCSQGGGQSMLRFLRSERKLGGWIGSVCHAPTAPHLPRSMDPLVIDSRSHANCSTPMRLLAAEQDSTFGRTLLERDVHRLRTVGGFTDVRMDILEGHGHEGPVDGSEGGLPEDLLYLQRCLPTLISGKTKA